MLQGMAERRSKDGGKGPSFTVSARLTLDELRKLDRIAERTPYRPSRSQLIAHAVREFLKQHDDGKRR